MWQVIRAGRAARAEAVQTPELDQAQVELNNRLVTLGDAGAFNERDAQTELKMQLHQFLIDQINLPALETASREQIESESLTL